MALPLVGCGADPPLSASTAAAAAAGQGTYHDTATTMLRASTTTTSVTTTTAPLAEIGMACSRTGRTPLERLRASRGRGPLTVSDDMDNVACYVAGDLSARGAWWPSFALDPNLCPGKETTFAVADTVDQLIEIAWVSNIIASDSSSPIGLATKFTSGSNGSGRLLAVLIVCK